MTEDPDVLSWRGELAFMAFEGAFLQIKGCVRFIELQEYEMAVKALERAMPFWASAVEEMRAIRSAVRSDSLTAEAAAEYRRDRDSRVRPTAGPKQPPRVEEPMACAEVTP